MKRFDVWANIVAAMLVWSVVTLFILVVMTYEAPGAPSAGPRWVWYAAIFTISLATLWLYVRRYWKKLDR